MNSMVDEGIPEQIQHYETKAHQDRGRASKRTEWMCEVRKDIQLSRISGSDGGEYDGCLVDCSGTTQ